MGKARAMAGRLGALRRYARGHAFDVALSHASHELPMVARSLGIPSSYAFDYEFAHCSTVSAAGQRGASSSRRRSRRTGSTPTRSERAQDARLPGPQGGIRPPWVRSASERPGRAGPRSQPVPRRRAHTSRRVALPPPRESPVPGCARAPGSRPVGAGSRPPSDGRAARRDSSASIFLRSLSPSRRSTRSVSSRWPTSSSRPEAR